MTKKEFIEQLEDRLKMYERFGTDRLEREVRLILTAAEQLDEPRECEMKIVGSNEYLDFDILTCSNCKESVYKLRWKNNFDYCPNCGAKIKYVEVGEC